MDLNFITIPEIQKRIIFCRMKGPSLMNLDERAENRESDNRAPENRAPEHKAPEMITGRCAQDNARITTQFERIEIDSIGKYLCCSQGTKNRNTQMVERNGFWSPKGNDFYHRVDSHIMRERFLLM